MSINADLQALARPIAWFKPDPKNARKHSARNIKAIADSLRMFGQQKPVVALEDGTIIAGNGTLEAAKSLGMPDLACVVFADVEKARAFAIADNRSAEFAEWDTDALEDTLREMHTKFTAADMGFDDVTLMTMGVRPHDRTVVTLPDDEAFASIGNSRNPFQQMTFVLHDTEAEVVKRVVAKFAADLPSERTNPNKNGAALAAALKTLDA